MNFQRLVKGLQDKGWTQSEIAEEIGCSQANIARLLKHKSADPRWRTGDALIMIAEQEGVL